MVSAVVPSYNRPEQTQRAVDSVVAQRYSPIELVVVDDGSSPPLDDRLEIPEGSLADRQVVRHDRNRGGNVARNTGIETASGEYIAFLDSDDEWRPEKIRRQVETVRASDARAVYTSIENVDAVGNLVGINEASHRGDIREPLLTGNVVGTFSSVLVESQTVDDVGYPDPDMPCWQDWEWFLRLSAETNFAAIADPLVVRHNEGGQISASLKPKRETAYPEMKERLRRHANGASEERAALASLDFRLGYASLMNGDYSSARRLFCRSILRKPSAVRHYTYLPVAGRHYPVLRTLKRRLRRVRAGE